MYYSIYYIFISISIMLGLYLVADRLDEIHYEIEDKYLPSKYKSQIVSFRISLKKKSFKFVKKVVKFEAYWMRRAAQFFLTTYLVMLIIGRILTRSFKFVVESWLVLYPLLAFAYPAISNITVLFYTRIREFSDKKNNW